MISFRAVAGGVASALGLRPAPFQTVRNEPFAPLGRFRAGSGWVVAGLIAAAPLSAADWPRFLGPAGDSVSTETGLLERFPVAGVPILWEKPIGTGYSAPSVRSDRVVYFHRQGNEEITEAAEAATGKPLWRHTQPSHYQDPYGYNNGPRCSPLLTTNRVYTFGAEGRLTCLDLATGKQVWQRDTATDFAVPEAFFGVGSTPLLDDNRLIVMVGGQPNAGVAALDPATGRTLWESVGQKCWDGVTAIGWRGDRPYRWTGGEKLASYSSPVAATIHGRRHLLCVMRQGLVSLDPATGAVNFTRWFQSEANDSVNAMCPVVQDDLILLSAAYYRVGSVLLRVKPDGKSYEEVWRSPQSPSERDTATQRFVEPTLGMHWAQPILVDGFLYGFSGRNEPDASLRCIEWATGKLRWARDESFGKHSAEQPDRFGRGSFIRAEGRLIALGEGGLLGLFRASAEKCEEICRWQVPSLRHPCWAAPVLADRRLYLRGEDRLICLNFAR